MRRLGLVACLLLVGRVARADEGDLQLTLVPAYAAVDFDSRTPSGFAFALELAYGLNDTFSLRALGIASLHPTEASASLRLPEGTLTVAGGFLGLRYTFDLLRVVPFLDLGVGALHAQGAGTKPAVNLAYEAAIGFDYLQTPRFAWGFVVSYHGFASDFSRLPIYLYAGPRFSFYWR